MTATKKTAAKKAPAKKTATTDETCLYCGRAAVGRLTVKGAAVCAVHKSRAEAQDVEVGKL